MIEDIPTRSKRELDIKNRCLELLSFYEGEDLEYELAVLTVDEWLDLYNCRSVKLKKPDKLREWETLNAEEKKSFEKRNPNWQEGEVKQYQEEVRSVESHNIKSKTHIKDCYEILKKRNDFRAQRLVGILSQFNSEAVGMETGEILWDESE